MQEPHRRAYNCPGIQGNRLSHLQGAGTLEAATNWLTHDEKIWFPRPFAGLLSVLVVKKGFCRTFSDDGKQT
jgi:hypothetical protein